MPLQQVAKWHYIGLENVRSWSAQVNRRVYNSRQRIRFFFVFSFKAVHTLVVLPNKETALTIPQNRPKFFPSLLTINVHTNHLRSAVADITSNTLVFTSFLYTHCVCLQSALRAFISRLTPLAKQCGCDGVSLPIMHWFVIQVPRDFRPWLTERFAPFAKAFSGLEYDSLCTWSNWRISLWLKRKFGVNDYDYDYYY